MYKDQLSAMLSNTVSALSLLADPAQSEMMGEPHMMVEYKLGLLWKMSQDTQLTRWWLLLVCVLWFNDLKNRQKKHQMGCGELSSEVFTEKIKRGHHKAREGTWYGELNNYVGKHLVHLLYDCSQVVISNKLWEYSHDLNVSYFSNLLVLECHSYIAVNDKNNSMSRLGISTDPVLCYLCADNCAGPVVQMDLICCVKNHSTPTVVVAH